MFKTAFWKHFPVADQQAETLSHETLEFDTKYDLDILKITPAGTWLATCYGLVDSWENDFLGRRTISHRCINSENDWLNLPLINKDKNLIDVYLDTARLLISKNTGKAIYTTVFCPVSQAVQMAGIDRFKEHLKSAPEKVFKGLNQITENTLLVLQRFADVGVSGNYFVSQAMQQTVLSRAEYALYGKPFDSECLKLSLKIFDNSIFHLHGEDIYFELDALLPEVMIHFEYNDAILVSLPLKNEILPGINVTQLTEICTEIEAMKLIGHIQDRTGTLFKSLTAGCVLPLNFPDDQVHFWKGLMRDKF